MTSTEDSDKGRFVYGPRTVGALVPGVVRPAFRRRAPATAQVLADWEAIVGPALAATTLPRRLSGDTLTLACAGPVAMELQHLSEALIARINSHLGRIVVRRLRFVQDSLPPPPAPPPPPPPQARAAASAAVAVLPAGELRDALERLGRAVLTDGPA